MRTLGIAGIVYALGLLAAVVGWVMNIIAVCHSDLHHIDGMLVVRAIGIFVPPLGAVMGYV